MFSYVLYVHLYPLVFAKHKSTYCLLCYSFVLSTILNSFRFTERSAFALPLTKIKVTPLPPTLIVQVRTHRRTYRREEVKFFIQFICPKNLTHAFMQLSIQKLPNKTHCFHQYFTIKLWHVISSIVISNKFLCKFD